MTDSPADTPAAAPKLDPESLVLRGSPRRVVRFRRGVIIAIAAIGSTALVGVTWMALKPVTFRVVAGSEDRGDPASKAPPDALADAPRTYGDVQQLGPPLPGDLGRPILAHQRAMAGSTQVSAVDPAAQAAEAERRAARESGVMMQVSRPEGEGGARVVTLPTAASPADASLVRASHDVERDANGQQRKADFLAARDDKGDVNSHGLKAPASPYTLIAGSVIAASLITGLNSDLPGLVTAQVTENTYDTVTGRILLIPQGARLIGSYDSVVAYGQKRALVVWQRIILPDGSSIRIDNVPATDTAGYAGLADKVDSHTWQLLNGVALSSLLGVGTQLSFGSDESDLVRAIRETTQQSGAQTGDQIVSRSLDIQPSITIRPGWPLRIVVHKDIVLPGPWDGGRR